MSHTARRLIAYLEGLEVTQGPLAGQGFEVLPWQRRWLRGTFRPGVTTSALTIARGGGKTTLLAGVGLAAVDDAGPLAVPRAEVIIVASSFEQAKLTHDHALAFLGKRRSDFRVMDSSNRAVIENPRTGAKMRSIGSDPRRAHGLAPALVLLDEGAQWPEATGEKMVAAVTTAAGKQPESRIAAIGTRPMSESHWFSKLLSGGADYSQVHAARPGDPPFQVRTWRRACPSLRHMPVLEAAVRAEAAKARRDPAARAAFDALRLNLGTSDVEAQVLLSADLWEELVALGPESPGGEPVGVWGVDLGGSAASSAVACFEASTGALRSLAAFPEMPPLPVRGIRDGVAGLYTDCARRGELITVGEHAVSYVALLAEAVARFGRPSMIAADRYRAGDLLDAMTKAGLRGVSVDWRGMGYRDGGEDVRHFRRACLERRVRPEPSLFLASAVASARTVTDAAANTKLAKATEGGRRLRARDDAAAASILAVSLAERRPRRESSGSYLGLVG